MWSKETTQQTNPTTQLRITRGSGSGGTQRRGELRQIAANCIVERCNCVFQLRERERQEWPKSRERGAERATLPENNFDGGAFKVDCTLWHIQLSLAGVAACLEHLLRR